MKQQFTNLLYKNRVFFSKRVFCLLVMPFTFFSLHAQNLVPNPSFEIFTNCPTTSSQISFAPPWTGADTSPDYFNACAYLVNWLGVPNVSFSYQQALSGNAFGGIIGFYHPGTNVREYLQIQLSETLQANKTYKVFAYANLVNYEQYAIHNLGINLSDVALSSPSETVIELSSSIINFEVAPIKDTMNWTRFGGIYKAQGNESYLAIGNFYNDLNTNRFLVYPNTTGDVYSYYFIDDVLVEEITQPFWQYHDTTIYYGDSVLIGPALTGLDIDWYTDNLDFISNAPGIYVTPPTSRDYIAKETFNGVETEHVVHVNVIGGAGLEENELQNVRVFPNPSKGSFSISGISSDQPLQLEVRDVHGKLVFETENLSKELNSFELDVENGVYFVTVECGLKNRKMVEKIVLMR